MSKKKRSAREAVISLGNLFNDLPDDNKKAQAQINAYFQTFREWDDKRKTEFIDRVLTDAFIQISVRDLIDSFYPGAGPKGPRLPAGVEFVDLLLHLANAQQRLTEKNERFDDWVAAHEWPGRMHPKPKTVRQWLRRYAEQIKNIRLQFVADAENCAMRVQPAS